MQAHWYRKYKLALPINIMHFTISASYLYKNLTSLYGVIVNNPLLPILGNFLFEISNSKLKIVSSDLQTSIVIELPLDVKEEAAVAVPARMLLDTLKNLPEQPIDFSIDSNTYSVSIKSNTGKYNLAGENNADFPAVPVMPAQKAISLPAEAFKKAIQQTIIAASHDDLKPAISGVYMCFSDTAFTFVATDIHRLIKYERTGISALETPSIILPRKTLLLLTNLISGEDKEIKLMVHDGNAYFQIGHTQVIARLVDEKYPDYENVIVYNNPNKLTINRRELLASLRRQLVYTNKVTYQVKFTLAEKHLYTLAEDLNFNSEASETLSCEYEGQENLEIGFNAKSLIELLHNLEAEEVTFYFSHATQGNQVNKAVVIIPNQQEKDENILLLNMPITLN